MSNPTVGIKKNIYSISLNVNSERSSFVFIALSDMPCINITS